jgi:hypothetical protein
MGRIQQLYCGISLSLVARVLVLPITLSVIDFSVTLHFQPPEYWIGDRTALIEFNPIARWVLMIHPLLIIPAMMTWYTLMFPLIFKMPASFGLRVISAHLLGHLIAISGWLIRMCDDGIWWVILLLGSVLALTVGTLGIYRGQWNSLEPIHNRFPKPRNEKSAKQQHPTA